MSAPLARATALAFAGAFTLPACGGEADANEGYPWRLPPGVEAPAVPEDNPMTPEKVELGRYLFYDTALSLEDNRACGVCHEQAKGFTDGFPRAIGTSGDLHPRNSLPLTNVGYFETLTWSDPTQSQLESQLLTPLLGTSPIIEMGMGGNEALLLDRLRDDPDYPERFAAAFPDADDPINLTNLARALASFERTLISKDSRYDRYLRGEEDAMTQTALRGMELFFGEARCGRCHGGPDLMSPTNEAGELEALHGYFNIGLYNLDDAGSYPAGNEGLYNATGELADMGRQRTPSLRNVEFTGPYMHDGSVDTLEHAVQIMVEGGRLLESGPNQGDGRVNPHKSDLLTPVELDATERAQLVTFLKSLTDYDFLTSPALGSPYPPFVPEPP